ncbi:hypothetical protein DL546_005637 [Coniochaeta pulveracea]|uniref:PH domain-containing protein n=2 Tax=Coniochaeta pulveracea TaxID=177199 RepID=A0A420Y948_9PEZI|nr:hypothetical protein DL546_005637 [Coniochaeta pulveracea]
MAGIEQLEIHSKSYIVRWVKVDEGHTISWSVQPHKKSINFGIVKHPGTGATNFTTQDDLGATAQITTESGTADTKAGLFAKRDGSTAQEQLAKKGFIPIKWHGRCEADKVSIGTYDVTSGGMFGLVFDNTFSKQTAKTATFVLLIYPTGNPPQTGHPLPNGPNLQASHATSSRTSLGKHSTPRIGGVESESVDSLHSHKTRGRALSTATRSEQGGPGGGRPGTPAAYHVGTLLKRRRKRGQGYARRFFSLDYATCTLSYYHNRNSSALRGAIPLSLAAIAADERRREISIDSGAEVWHLRASNAKEFNEWARALERASRIARGLESPPVLEENTLHRHRSLHQHHDSMVVQPLPNPPNTYEEQDREWQQVEALVSRVVGTRDALRRLVKDIAAEKQQAAHHHQQQPGSSGFLSPGSSAVSEEGDNYFTPVVEKRPPFWKRKSSASPLTPSTALQTPASGGLAVHSQGSTPNVPGQPSGNPTLIVNKRKSRGQAQPEERSTQDHCVALLNDLDSVVNEFSTLLAISKRRRLQVPTLAEPRHSFESRASTAEEFFDAEAGDSVSRAQSNVVRIEHASEEDAPFSDGDQSSIHTHSSSSVSSVDDEEDDNYAGSSNLYPPRPKSLAPLPITESVGRRTTIPPAKVLPPSLIAFVRKNVGKDLSTISMPVSANEPTSLLQRVAEQLEYADLLTRAASMTSPRDRLLYVTAFAVSQFSNSRAKERAIRKPFNPLLGETFELLRTENEVPGGFRLLVEKVSHRPVRLAMHADAAAWSFAQSPAPTQKFWGKSAELTTEGRVRVSLRLPDGTDERYSWGIATVFLRNVVMGEKYVEPVGTMTVTNDTAGSKASIEFRTKGMFGGRGEEVSVETYDSSGRSLNVGLTGTWTAGLRILEGKTEGEQIWAPGALVPNPANTYGMTTFAASLNEITPLEKGKLPPTDSRLRPDQRLAEEGNLDEAEEWKVKLEEAQRRRRRDMEERGEEWKPRWFVKLQDGGQGGGEEVWRLRGGKEGYWEERSKGTWNGVEEIFDV